MMALPNSQLDTTYWLPWYNNVDLDTQLRFGNVGTVSDVTPPAAITDLAATPGSGNGTVELTWTSPGDDGSGGVAASYQARYSSSEIASEGPLGTRRHRSAAAFRRRRWRARPAHDRGRLD